jgi:hypothetical protein
MLRDRYGGAIDVNQFTVATEIFPSHLRSMGTGIAMSGLFLADTLWLQLSSTMATIGWKYYLVFLCLGVVHTIYLYFNLPEVRQPLRCSKCGRAELTWFLISRLPGLPWKRLMPCSVRLWQDISRMKAWRKLQPRTMMERQKNIKDRLRRFSQKMPKLEPWNEGLSKGHDELRVASPRTREDTVAAGQDLDSGGEIRTHVESSVVLFRRPAYLYNRQLLVASVRRAGVSWHLPGVYL